MHLVGHSMGGVSARYYIKILNGLPNVASYTLLAPQRPAQADQGDADGNREQPFVDLRQQGDRSACGGADREERRGPPGEDACAEERDAEDDAAGQVGDAHDQEGGVQQADVAGRGTAAGGGEDVVDVGRCTVSQGWEDGRTDELDAQHDEIAGAEQDVPSRPSTPIFLTWLRYIPVMPVRARAAISTFSVWRTVYSAVAVKVASRGGGG
ncbi:MAG: esterase/lipase family protein [Pseudonocardia sp.]